MSSTSLCSNERVPPPPSADGTNKQTGTGFETGFTWKSVFVAFGVGGAFLGYMQYMKEEKAKRDKAARAVKTVGKSFLGGDWELIDTEEKTVCNKDYLGQWTLLYFGFTHCPDICPEELDKICHVVDRIDENKKMPSLTPFFITVDPTRDTPKQIKEYIAEFSPKIVGLTGSADQIRKVTRAYRIYYSMGPVDIDNDYIVDHSIISYLIDPEGNFVQYYGQDKQEEEMYQNVCQKISLWQPGQD